MEHSELTKWRNMPPLASLWGEGHDARTLAIDSLLADHYISDRARRSNPGHVHLEVAHLNLQDPAKNPDRPFQDWAKFIVDLGEEPTQTVYIEVQ